jgi:hypothetical protein
LELAFDLSDFAFKPSQVVAASLVISLGLGEP